MRCAMSGRMMPLRHRKKSWPNARLLRRCSGSSKSVASKAIGDEKKSEKKLAIILNCAILNPVSERNNNMKMNELKNQMFLTKVQSLLSDDALHYADVESIVDQALTEGWTVKECAHQCEQEV